MRLTVAVVLFMLVPLAAQSPKLPSHLNDYVAKDDGAFAWKIVSPTNDDGVTHLKVTSQKWQNELWEHDVQIFVPKGVTPGATVVLYNDGGTVNAARTAFGQTIAAKAKAPVVFVLGVPKQPLYGKREDALIADTFVKYLDTKDPTLPLLFPMVKSVVRGMDAVQAFAKQEWKTDVTGFVVSGASKRGWTTWLTAATGDNRVKAIAPLVFDSLNLLEQMPNQVKSFGRFSEMIKDYEQHKLLPLPDTTEARQLWAMVDPYAYLDKLTMPKLIVNGTNDRYWAQDALNYYWNDLKGPKNVCYVPNAGHDLRAMSDPGAEKPSKDLFPMRAVDALAAFCRCVIAEKLFPKIDVAAPKSEAGKGTIEVSFDVTPKAVRTMTASSATRDFRKQKWSVDATIAATNGKPTKVDMTTDQPFKAFFLECEYEVDGHKYCLSTPICIVEKK